MPGCRLLIAGQEEHAAGLLLLADQAGEPLRGRARQQRNRHQQRHGDQAPVPAVRAGQAARAGAGAIWRGLVHGPIVRPIWAGTTKRPVTWPQVSGSLANRMVTGTARRGRPDGEGYAKAEVTPGGIDTAALSSQSREAKTMPGLHVIGETVDVTGHPGGFNVQWARNSEYAYGQSV